MAGYGTTLEADAQFDPLIRALMLAAQRRARSLGLRMKYRSHPGEGRTDWELSVDGNGYLIAAWSQQLERDLPLVAEGYVGVGEGRQARNAAVSFVARWIAWCVGDEERTVITTTGSDRVRWLWPVMDIPEPPSPLAARLAISDSLVARWLVGDLPEEVAIEELHTSVEGLLRVLLGVGKGPNWPALLTAAESAGVLKPMESATLGTFNVLYRNHLKHQALALSNSDRATAGEVMRQVLQIGERLLARLP
jgi:hypothetical protein